MNPSLTHQVMGLRELMMSVAGCLIPPWSALLRGFCWRSSSCFLAYSRAQRTPAIITIDFITQKYEICHTSAKLSPQAHFLLPLIAPVNLPLILLSPFSQALKQISSFSISSLSLFTISYQREKLPSLLRGEPFLCLALPHLLPLPPGCQGFRFLPGLSHS